MSTSTFDAAAHPRAVSGEFVEKRNDAPKGSLVAARDLTTETPVAIDEELAELHYSEVRIRYEIDAANATIERYTGYLNDARHTYSHGDYRKAIERAEERIEALRTELGEVQEQQVPFTAEFTRRGGWPRAFLVSGGHLHRSMGCSTCNREGRLTRFAWMTEYSGASEEEIVDAAASRACTTCFPSAPVDVLNRPSTLLTPDEREAAEVKAAREAEKAAKLAEREAKAITAPDGSPLKFGMWEARSLVTAERELVDSLMEMNLDEVKPIPNREFAAERVEWSDRLVAAIAHKKGVPADQVRAEAAVKAQKKSAKILREWGY